MSGLTLWGRAGVPPLAGNGRFVGATAIDSLGTGLILAFTVIFFDRTTSVSLPAIGAAMTAARLLALPTSVVVGPLIDRFSARRVAAAGNLVSTLGYTGFLLADGAWTVLLVVFVVQVGHTAYWTSSGGLVALAAPESARTRWFGFVHALRNSGMGLGGALGAFAFALGDTRGLYLIAVANAASFLVAAVLLASWRPAHERSVAPARPAEPALPASAASAQRDDPGPRGYRTVLRDGRYALLLGTNLTLVFAQMLIKILLAIYIVEALDMEAWIAGTLIVVATVQVAVLQTYVTRHAEGHRIARVIAVAALLNALAFGIFAALYVAPQAVVLPGLFVAMTIFTFGEILGLPAIDSLSVALAPEAVRGRYLAVYQLSWTVGEVAAPLILTFLLARAAVLPMLFLLVLSLLALPLLRALEPRLPAAAPSPADAAPVDLGHPAPTH